MGRHDEVEDGMGFSGLCGTDASEDRCWKELGERNQQLIDAKAKIELLRRAVAFIAEFKGKTLIAPSMGEDADRGHQLGAHKAFNQAAEIAEDVLRATAG